MISNLPAINIGDVITFALKYRHERNKAYESGNMKCHYCKAERRHHILGERCSFAAGSKSFAPENYREASLVDQMLQAAENFKELYDSLKEKA